MEKAPGTGNSQIELDFDNKYDNEPPIKGWLVVKTVHMTIEVEAATEEEAKDIAGMLDDEEFEVEGFNMKVMEEW